MTTEDMNPVEKYAALRALELGIGAAVAVAAMEVAEYRKKTRSRGFESDWGTIEFRKNDAHLQFNTTKLIAWAQQHLPHEVIPEHTEEVIVPAAARPTLLKTLDERFQIVGGEVIDTVSGEVVDFATIIPAKPPTLAFKMPPEKKREAVEYVAHQTALVASVMRPELEAS
jgi:hypothetical protein